MVECLCDIHGYVCVVHKVWWVGAHVWVSIVII